MRFASAVYSSDTRPPPWRSSRPAISSSSSTVRTTAGEVRDSRTRSSSATGVGPSRPTMRLRSSSAGSVRGRTARLEVRLLRRQIEAAAEDRLQHRDHVGGLGDQRCTLLEQAVGAFRARIERRARHREHFAALLAGEPRRDQRAGAARRLDDHDADREAGDEPVAAREVARARLPAERHFRHRRALSQHRFQQLLVFGRVNALEPAGEHGNRAAGEARAMRSGVDAARQARHDAETVLAQLAREPLGEFDAGRGGIARADDRDHRAREDRFGRAPRSAAAGRRSSAGAPDSPVRPARRI